VITVLVLASSPVEQGPLHLGKEHKVIEHSLNSATNREQFRIVTCMATTVDDLRRYLLEHSPTIVHFGGHGAGEKGLCFEDESGATQTVNGERLAKLFHLVNEDVKCVVLNACLSEVQARAISEHIDFVIGMKEEIGDSAALKFAQGFYEAIWAGQSYEKAFKFGCSAIDTANIPEEQIPVILKSPRLGGGVQLEYGEATQRLENFLLRFLNSSARERAGLTTQGEAIIPKLTESERQGPRRIWSSVSVVSVATVYMSYKEVTTVIRSGLNAVQHTFYLKPNGDSYLLDWDATKGQWPVPFKTFMALGTNQPITVRVDAELSDYFNYGYEKETYVSIELRHLSGERIHGYIHCDHKDFQPLVEHLYDGKSHRVIVEIFPAKNETSCVLITKFVSHSWIMPGPEELATSG
jgi:hypothetical protein